MKKILLFLLLLTGIANAQIVNIPDANLKTRLLMANSNNAYIAGIASPDGTYFTAGATIDTNGDGNIQVAEAQAIHYLDISTFSGSPMTIYNLTGIEAFTNLQFLDCSANMISNLNINGLLQLKNLTCNENLLTVLDLSIFPGLKSLNCFLNGITALDFTGLNDLESVNCAANQLTSLDFHNNPKFFDLGCANNSGLTSINIKNGKIQNTTIGVLQCDGWFGLSNPTNLCVDENEIIGVGQMLAYSNPNLNIAINSYCSFVPGGSYNTIAGNIQFDDTNNGCDVNDSPLSFVKIKIEDGANSGITYGNASGNYSFYTQAGNFTITPEIENASLFTVSPSSAIVNFANNNNNVSPQNFCVTANGVHPDVEIIIAPVGPARPGFNAVYKIIYKNKGNQMVSGNINFNYNNAVLDYVSASVAPSTQDTGVMGWNYNNLAPFESRSITVVLNTNGPMETPPVNIGDVLSFSATINPALSDETPADNVFNYNQTVVGSFDPNDKQCIEGAIVDLSKIGDYLHYIIRFENTGTAAAENIVVKDVIDTAKFDISSLQVLDASHPVVTKITGNKTEFIFENINLAANAHGDVTFKIKTKNTLAGGDVVTNKADIFFDYNFPIETNLASTLFQSLGTDEFKTDDSVYVYPNPTTNLVNIKANSTISSVQLFDVQGRILVSSQSQDSQWSFDISRYPHGVYFLKISTEKGIKVERIIKK